MRPEQIDLLPRLSAPSLHPDGDRAVVSLVRPDVATNEYVGQLWSVPLRDGAPWRLTRGHRDTSPQISPDGEWVAFLRAEPGGARPQLHVVRADGGEPVRLSDATLGAGAPRWSPDSRRIAYVARQPEAGRYGTDPDVSPDAEPPRLITDLRYLQDGVGYVGDRHEQVFLVEVPGVHEEPVAGPPAPPTQVTHGPHGSSAVAWSPDGARLAFVSARHQGRSRDLRTDVWTVKPDGSDLVCSTDTTLAVDHVAWSGDGATLWLLAVDTGVTGVDMIARHTGLFSVPADGSAPPLRRTDAETVDLGEVGAMLTVTPAGTDDGVLVQNRTRGAVELLRVRAGHEPEVVLGGRRWVTGHDARRGDAGDVVVATVTSDTSAGQLVLCGADRVLLDAETALGGELAWRPQHELTITAGDGYPVHGWVVMPDGPGPHPVLLDVHGGPFAQYGWQVYDEAQVLAAAGYAVLLANPRGSAGYGQQHGRCVAGALGDRDAADLLDFLDGALADPALQLDASRLAVLGGSYGGYMTAWLTAHPRSADRFAAAIVERGFLDPESFAGTADIGWFFGHELVGTDPQRIAAQSPMAAVDRVRTPTLVIHSERDFRCPLEQGQRYFARLLGHDVPAELLIFPGESHGLTRDGQPRHRRQRLDHVLRWFAQHLPTEANQPARAG